MKAVGYERPGAIDRPDALIDMAVAEPTIRPRDLLVRVKAVSVNPVDTKVRAGMPPLEGEPARILGWDAAGVIEAIGPDVADYAIGDEVFYAGTLNRHGTNAELHAVDERIVGMKPRSIDWAEAAALPLTAVTAWELLFERLGVARGATGTLLVINGAGGVGSVLIQLARALTDLTVIATASRPETIDWVRRMGAHHVIDHRRPLDEALREAGFDRADFVASLTASDRHLPAIIALIAPQGHVALIDDPAAFDITPFKRKSVTVAWEYMFTRSVFETADMAEQGRILNEVAALVDAGRVRTTLTRRAGRIDAAGLTAVHALIERGEAIGKIVLEGF